MKYNIEYKNEAEAKGENYCSCFFFIEKDEKISLLGINNEEGTVK